MALAPLAGGDPAVVGGYRLRGRLGAGGMGVVYLAYTPGGRPVALKVVRPELGDDADFRARFRQEVDAARRVSGLFTAPVLDADPEGSPPWLATGYVAGPSLQQAVAGHGPLPADSVLALVAGVAEALAAIHAAGVVHRDLKPSNVLLAADGPRVIDFGIARAVESTALTQTGMQVGSPQYMSPEQVRGAPVTAAADVWALGALACFAATGRPPFGDGAQAAVLYRVLHEEPDLAGCPDAVRAVIGQCLDRNPAARPSPARVMELCQAGAAGQTAEYTHDWLPPTLAADLAGHALPVVTPPAAAAQAGPAAAAQPGLAAAAQPGLAATAGPATFALHGPGAAATVPPPHAAPVPGLAPPAPPLPGGTTPAMLPGGGGTRQLRRRPSRTIMACVAAAVVVLAVLIGYGVSVLSRPGSRSTSHSPSAAGAGAGHRTSGSSNHAASSGRASPGTSRETPGAGSASPAATPRIDQCLVGTWFVTSDQLINTIGGTPVPFTGSNGWTVTIQANGQSSETFSQSELTAQFDGNSWSDVLNGTAIFDITTDNGQMTFSNQSANGTWTLYENGSYNNGGPLTLNPSAATYSCAQTSFMEVSDDGLNEQSFHRAS